jgi:hypothetical protein
MHAFFHGLPVVSGFVASRGLPDGQRFESNLSYVGVASGTQLALSFESGPIETLFATVLQGRLETVGILRGESVPTLLSGVLVNRKPFVELSLEWQRHLAS